MAEAGAPPCECMYSNPVCRTKCRAIGNGRTPSGAVKDVLERHACALKHNIYLLFLFTCEAIDKVQRRWDASDVREWQVRAGLVRVPKFAELLQFDPLDCHSIAL